MNNIKHMAFSGSWYPSDPDECRQSIETFVNEKNGPEPGAFIGGVVPHAGWFFSGSIACRVIASLNPSESVDLVILFGGHMHPSSPSFLLSHGSVATPFGQIPIADEVADLITGRASVIKHTPDRFPDENTLELQYPFVHHFFPNAQILPICVSPNDSAIEIGKAAAETARQLSLNARFIGSTDMTHYGPNYGFTSAGSGKKALDWVKNENDRNAIEALLEMDGEKIISQGLSNQNMCCSGAAAAAATACKESGAVKGIELDYATSYEKSAGASFVGYSGILYA